MVAHPPTDGVLPELIAVRWYVYLQWLCDKWEFQASNATERGRGVETRLCTYDWKRKLRLHPLATQSSKHGELFNILRLIGHIGPFSSTVSDNCAENEGRGIVS